VQVAVACVAERRGLQIVRAPIASTRRSISGIDDGRHHRVFRLLELVRLAQRDRADPPRLPQPLAVDVVARDDHLARALASHTAPHASTAASIPSGSPSSSTSTIAPASAGNLYTALGRT
jgi:hypothetical protein